MQYREFSSIDRRYTVFYRINFENPIMLKLRQLAIAKSCSFDHAFNRFVMDTHCYEGGEYHPQGYVVFDGESLKVWSVRNLLELARFLYFRKVI